MSQQSGLRSILGLAATCAVLSACSGGEQQEQAKSNPEAVPEVQTETSGSEPGSSLSFEWSANGFEQLPAQYQWTGSGQRDDVFQPNFSLSVPETDDVVWSSSCEAGGNVVSQAYFAPPKNMKGNRARFKFGTDASTKTLEYDVTYSASGQLDGLQLVQNATDPMFAAMKAGKWAYIQIGEGSDATKLRISLVNAAKSLNAFLPACAKPKAQATAAATPAAVTYQCKDGRTARATYLGNDTDTPAVRLLIGDEQYLLSQIVSGSGARYDNSHEKQSDKRRTWHNKGKGSLLIESAWDDVEGSGETIVHCMEP
jgi:membrane-bound inhibitor of C-type lysozyme